MEMFLKIGQGRREFEDIIRLSADRRKSDMADLVKAVDPSTEEGKTFDGGLAALVHWFRESVRL